MKLYTLHNTGLLLGALFGSLIVASLFGSRDAFIGLLVASGALVLAFICIGIYCFYLSWKEVKEQLKAMDHSLEHPEQETKEVEGIDPTTINRAEEEAAIRKSWDEFLAGGVDIPEGEVTITRTIDEFKVKVTARRVPPGATKEDYLYLKPLLRSWVIENRDRFNRLFLAEGKDVVMTLESHPRPNVS